MLIRINLNMFHGLKYILHISDEKVVTLEHVCSIFCSLPLRCLIESTCPGANARMTFFLHSYVLFLTVPPSCSIYSSGVPSMSPHRPQTVLLNVSGKYTCTLYTPSHIKNSPIAVSKICKNSCQDGNKLIW